MSDTNNTLKKKENQYHHLTEQDRATIQTLIEQKDKNGRIKKQKILSFSD